MDQHANMIGADTDAVRVHMDGYLNSVGHMYGAAWRNAPRSVNHVLLPQIPIEDMPSDRLAGYEETYTSIIKGLQNQGDPEAYVPTRAETYNFQYRQTCDQINELILGLRQRPWSSRHVVSAWIPEWIPSETLSPQANVLLDLGALAPCHFAFQCFVSPPAEGSDRLRLSLMLNMRSSDVAVGWSYNIAQYALLLHLIASVTNMEPYELIYVGGDVHLYTNQLDTVREQLSRDPLPMPQIWVNPAIKDIFAFTEQDIKISDYQYHDAIIHQVAV
jgi:thymidylate synthase